MPPIYTVADRTDPEACRLVRAANRAQALRHVAEDELRVEIPSQDRLVELITGGNVVEDARPVVADAAD